MRELVLRCLSLFSTLSVVYSHVAFTFPTARYPPLDFLDTSRTMGPCGVPKPKIGKFTNLVMGESYNFTWRMQYPHQGGYRILLLDGDGNELEQLVPMNGLAFAGTNDQTSQSERVRFSRPCSQCTVVLERQALEWGRSYRFRSCADVNVLEAANEESKCSGHGAMNSAQCVCDSGYTGDICQYIAHCSQDADCLNDGRCIEEASSLVVKSCFCAYGFFGRNCEQNVNRQNDNCFAYSSRDAGHFEKYGMFNSNCFNKEKLNEHDEVYFRKIKNDVEIILDFASSSWVSLGWRPEGLAASCRLFPDLEGVRSKRQAGANPFATDEALDEEDDSDLHRQLPPSRIAQEGPRPIMPKNNGLLDSALRAPLHAMDCVDVVVGAVRDSRLRIQDMYSRDRSTPLEDYWYEGEMSLTAAYGFEKGDRTVVMFRRWQQEIEPTDHPLGPGRMFVVWAKGQTRGMYMHVATSALESNHSDPEFYPDDQLKYHGNRNRGVHPIDFTIPLKTPKPSEVAFGVNIAKVEDRIETDHHAADETSPAEPSKPTELTEEGDDLSEVADVETSAPTASASGSRTRSTTPFYIAPLRASAAMETPMPAAAAAANDLIVTDVDASSITHFLLTFCLTLALQFIL